jgi:serine/threonine-protein kinase
MVVTGMPTRVVARPSGGPRTGEEPIVGDLASSSASPSLGGVGPGSRLGRYELLHPIAAGGMAQVWAAEQIGDLGFRKVVAVKTILPQFAFDPGFRAMFLDEAQLASRIQHVNAVEVLDLGVEGNVVFQAMTLIEGVSLSEWLRHLAGDRLPVGVAVRIAVDMLRGLHAAHELCDDAGVKLGLVHRDVSPQNVLVSVDGITKLADFGIAKAFGRVVDETAAGQVKGKVAYMAPEQLGGLPAAPQGDLFSAGVVLWEALTGERLFPMHPDEDGERVRAQLGPRDPRTVAPDLSPRIAAITMRALEADPFARFSSSLEMADALEAIAQREGVDTSHRHVAVQLQADLGDVVEESRERLRAARRREPMAAPRFDRERGRRPAEDDDERADRDSTVSLAFAPTAQSSRGQTRLHPSTARAEALAPLEGYAPDGLTNAPTIVATGAAPLPTPRRPPERIHPLVAAATVVLGISIVIAGVALLGRRPASPAPTVVAMTARTPEPEPPAGTATATATAGEETSPEPPAASAVAPPPGERAQGSRPARKPSQKPAPAAAAPSVAASARPIFGSPY